MTPRWATGGGALFVVVVLSVTLGLGSGPAAGPEPLKPGPAHPGPAAAADPSPVQATTTSVAPVATAPVDVTGETTTTTLGAALAVPVQPDPPAVAPDPSVPFEFDGLGAIVVGRGGADLVETPGQPPLVRVREGVVLAGRGLDPTGEWVQVFHVCDDVAWVRADEVAVVPPADPGAVGDGFDIADAVVVIDPGHGGPNIGGSSPAGLVEKIVNVEIAARVRDLLSSPHSVDWDTGTVHIGEAIPAVRDVVVTRSGAGADADYEAGLDFRAALADALEAHAMVSIHNNAGWEIRTEGVGSDVYYQSQQPVVAESRRLAVLLVEEFRRGFAGFDADWAGSSVMGAKSRISPRDNETQYYGLLKATRVPTVIAEGAYISNPSEAALLETPEFQQAYAEAVYRALIRFLSTDDPGDAPSHDPVVWAGSAGRGGAGPECEIPEQPPG